MAKKIRIARDRDNSLVETSDDNGRSSVLCVRCYKKRKNIPFNQSIYTGQYRNILPISLVAGWENVSCQDCGAPNQNTNFEPMSLRENKMRWISHDWYYLTRL